MQAFQTVNLTVELLSWYGRNARKLPWRESLSPYSVWLSEVILQQTRVNQGMEYYLRFMSQYPTVCELAGASEDEVLKLWQGLGYYSRARNMHQTARWICFQNQGIFPDSFDSLKRLKGVGEYTAAAISSIAFNEAVPVLDGNVFRVLSRIFGIEEYTDSPAGRKVFFELASQFVPKDLPGLYNQAIMEFGALFCTPTRPDCENCIFRDTCRAFATGKVSELPRKKSKTAVKELYQTYIIVLQQGKVLVQKRDEAGIWGGLYQFPLIERNEAPGFDQLYEELQSRGFSVPASSIELLPDLDKHLLSHRKIFANYVIIRVVDEISVAADEFISIPVEDLHKLPVSKLIDRFLQNNYSRLVGY